MKVPGLSLMAVALAGSIAFASPAPAQRHVEVNRTVVVHRGHRMRRHRVCRTHWVHHRRVRRCFWR